MIKIVTFLKQAKSVYLKLNGWISSRFFYSNTYFFKILKTFFFNRVLKLENDYIPYSNNIEFREKSANQIKSKFKNDKNLNTPNSFYSVQTLEYIPSFYTEILKKNRNNIEKYLGKKIKYEKIILTCRKNIPKPLENQELYNNTWHQDCDTYKQLRIFFLVDPVSLKDGPFTYLSLANTKKYWRKIKEKRSGEDSILNFDEQQTFTGSRGEYLIVDPSRRLHRASNPSTERYMFSMTLYPFWEKNTTDIERFDWSF